MNGIVINIDPVAFHLGPFHVLWYSLAIILAIVAGVLITKYRTKKRGIAMEHIYSALPWMILGGIVGSRLFHVIDYWEYYISNPAQILGFAGQSIYGALAGGAAVAIGYALIKHIPLDRLGDSLAPGVLVGQMIGRLGCIINGDAYGGITNLPWAFIYTHPNAMIPSHLHGLPTHPYPVYEMLWNAVVLVIILRLNHHLKKDGLVFVGYLSLYSLGRFVLTFVRQETIIFWGLQQAQIVALLGLAASLVLAIYSIRKRPLPEMK